MEESVFLFSKFIVRSVETNSNSAAAVSLWHFKLSEEEKLHPSEVS